MKFKAAFSITVVAQRTHTWYLLCGEVLATTVPNADTHLSKKASRTDGLPPHLRLCHSTLSMRKSK